MELVVMFLVVAVGHAFTGRACWLTAYRRGYLDGVDDAVRALRKEAWSRGITALPVPEGIGDE